MTRADWQSTRDLIEEIRQDGPRFKFFQAVRLLALSAAKENNAASATSPIPPALRFVTPASLAFPASEILEVNPRTDLPNTDHDNNDADDIAHAADRLALSITIGFMGLTGPSGVLPNVYTEMLIERRNTYRDTTAHSFFDMFVHRAASLFYDAWRKPQLYLTYEAGEHDRSTRHLLDVMGMGFSKLQGSLQQRGHVPDMFLMHFAGLLADRPVSAINMAELLRGYFHVEVEIEQFVGQWIMVPEKLQTRLGTQSCTLGNNAFCGKRLWDRQSKICIKLGPLTHDQFTDFLPGQPGAVALQALVRFCIGQTLACDVQLCLHKDHVPLMQLSKTNPTPLRLGYNTWLHKQAPATHQDGARFALEI